MRNIGMLGGVGETMALLGIGLLWTFRAQAAEWLRELLDIWRGEISGRDPQLSDPLYRRVAPRRPRGALILICAVALLFIGQILFLIDLTFF
ncbi:MAG TPA: hypothetical protein VGI34_05410 [Candidatus Acidoferrales bacterium]|jgi:hypothetical protein